jgi:hypothetical protein
MAAVTPTVTFYAAGQDGSVLQAVWVLTTTDNIGLGFPMDEWVDRTWHVKIDGGGSIGGGTVAVETAPTDTDADYAACKNAAGGAAISLTGATAATSIENAGFMRPKLNGSTGASGVRVTMRARRPNPMRQ